MKETDIVAWWQVSYTVFVWCALQLINLGPYTYIPDPLKDIPQRPAMPSIICSM
jgi:hypothetical protein